MKHAEIERLLPSILQRADTPGSPLAALLDVMEWLQGPDESVLDDVVRYFNARSAPARFLPMLAHWVNVERVYPQLDSESPGPDWTADARAASGGRMRELVALAPRLAQLRGTSEGLALFLRTVVGSEVRIEEPVLDGDGSAIPFHVRIVIPGTVAGEREVIERIIELEVPAFITHELIFGDALD